MDPYRDQPHTQPRQSTRETHMTSRTGDKALSAFEGAGVADQHHDATAMSERYPQGGGDGFQPMHMHHQRQPFLQQNPNGYPSSTGRGTNMPDLMKNTSNRHIVPSTALYPCYGSAGTASSSYNNHHETVGQSQHFPALNNGFGYQSRSYGLAPSYPQPSHNTQYSTTPTSPYNQWNQGSAASRNPWQPHPSSYARRDTAAHNLASATTSGGHPDAYGRADQYTSLSDVVDVHPLGDTVAKVDAENDDPERKYAASGRRIKLYGAVDLSFISLSDLRMARAERLAEGDAFGKENAIAAMINPSFKRRNFASDYKEAFISMDSAKKYVHYRQKLGIKNDDWQVVADDPDAIASLFHQALDCEPCGPPDNRSTTEEIDKWNNWQSKADSELHKLLEDDKAKGAGILGEAAALNLVRALLKVRMDGVLVEFLEIKRSTYKPDYKSKTSEIVQEIVQILKDYKPVCLDVVKGACLDKFVTAPQRYLKEKLNNCWGNLRRSRILAAAKEIHKNMGQAETLMISAHKRGNSCEDEDDNGGGDNEEDRETAPEHTPGTSKRKKTDFSEEFTIGAPVPRIVRDKITAAKDGSAVTTPKTHQSKDKGSSLHPAILPSDDDGDDSDLTTLNSDEFDYEGVADKQVNDEGLPRKRRRLA